MRDIIQSKEVTLELEEITGADVRGRTDGALEAELREFARPLRPLELVHPPKPAPTLICFEVCRPAPTERQRKAQTLSWFDRIALISVLALAFFRLPILDLSALWT